MLLRFLKLRFFEKKQESGKMYFNYLAERLYT